MPRVLGVDYGKRRIGLAISDPHGIVALPLRVVRVRSPQQAVREAAAVCRERKPERVVVGLPLNMNGTPGEMTRHVEEFVSVLARVTNLPVELWDERLTTKFVERSLIASDVSKSIRKRVTDKLAAQVILQSYLDARQERACHDTG